MAAKYVARWVILILLLLLLLGLAGYFAFRLLAGPEEGPGSSGSGSAASGQSRPEPAPPSSSRGDEGAAPVQSGGGEIAPPESSSPPEPESQPEPGSAAEPPASAAGTGSGDWQLILINPTHAIEQELNIEFTEVNGYKFDSRIAGKVRELLAAAEEDGIHLAIISGYRTMERSRVLYANKIAEYRNMGYDEAAARVEAAKWVAPPGTSEHHSGLAMDIVSSDYYTKYSDLVEAFENDKEAIWLRENCARFGFILRFPKDKVEITGINYEPWHFRYVGEEAAKEIMEKGLCLEEYLGITD